MQQKDAYCTRCQRIITHLRVKTNKDGSYITGKKHKGYIWVWKCALCGLILNENTVPPCMGCDHPAEWHATFAKLVEGTFGKDQYYCGPCLLEDLNGEHTGGGPTLNCFHTIERIAPLKDADLYYNVKEDDK